MKKTVQLILLAALTVQLVGCGFHLRGTEGVGALNVESAYVSVVSKTDQDLFNVLKRNLKSNGINLDSKQPEIEIALGSTEYKTSRTSSGSLGDVTSQLMRMSQTFSVTETVSGKKVFSGTVQTLRDRRIQSQAILAADSELKSIKQSMREDLVAQIIRRLRSENKEFELLKATKGK